MSKIIYAAMVTAKNPKTGAVAVVKSVPFVEGTPYDCGHFLGQIRHYLPHTEKALFRVQSVEIIKPIGKTEY